MRFPNPIRLAVSLATWLAAVFRGATLVVPDDVAFKRNEICKACEHYQSLGDAVGQCQICTCITDMKALVPTESCPDSPPRWGQYKNEKQNGLQST